MEYKNKFCLPPRLGMAKLGLTESTSASTIRTQS
jgi:hypothetical protein